MKIKQLIYSVLLAVALVFTSCESKKIDALIVTGQSNKSHNWEASHKAVEKILLSSNMFNVDVAISPKKGEDMSLFSPDFDKYDVVVLDYDGDDWSKSTEEHFEKYIENGGGLVVFHGTNNSFPNWKAFNEMTALGGWNGRTEKDGPYVRWKGDKMVKVNEPGKGGMHGKKNPFVITTRNAEHPITKGLPLQAMHTTDELYGKLRGPAKNIDLLASAYSDPKQRGSGYHEPVLFTVTFGKGRIFHNVLGHVGKDENMVAYKSAYFIYTMQRGTEWAATGNVTQAIPEDLPNKHTPLVLPLYRAFTLDDIFKNAKKYNVGSSKKYINLMVQRIKNHGNDGEYIAEMENRMIELLNAEDCSVAAKNAVCKELSWMGSDKCIETLKELSTQEETQEMAKYALTRLTK